MAMWTRRDGRQFLVAFGVFLGASALAAEKPNAEPQWQTPQLAAGLESDPAYTQYCVMLIQLDMLANPDLASLPVEVESTETGTIDIRGIAPNAAARDYVVQNAHRISGLVVRDNIRTGRVSTEAAIRVDAAELHQATIDTIRDLFPELADEVRVASAQGGVIVLQGKAPSVETKLALSHTLKSHPACTAVISLVSVAGEEAGGMLRITDDGASDLASDELPKVPAAPLVNFSTVAQNPGVGRARPPQGLAADDAPGFDVLDRQLSVEVRAMIEQQPDLLDSDLQVDVQFGTVYLVGDLRNRSQVEDAVEAASEIVRSGKIVAKCRPVSIQRNIPSKASIDKTDAPEKGRLASLFFWTSNKKNDDDPSSSWRFRESIRRALKKRCGDQADNISIRHTINGLMIEADVKDVRSRTAVFKQIDNLAELRGVKYDAVLKIKEN